MSKEDLRQYSSEELALRVANEEPLYLVRHHPNLDEILDEVFTYTDQQHDRLMDYLDAEGEA